jgi:hypothetical protein
LNHLDCVLLHENSGGAEVVEGHAGGIGGVSEERRGERERLWKSKAHARQDIINYRMN